MHSKVSGVSRDRPSMGYLAHRVARRDSSRSGLPLGTMPPVVTSATVVLRRSRTGGAGGTTSNMGRGISVRYGSPAIFPSSISTARSEPFCEAKVLVRRPRGRYPISSGGPGSRPRPRARISGAMPASAVDIELAEWPVGTMYAERRPISTPGFSGNIAETTGSRRPSATAFPSRAQFSPYTPESNAGPATTMSGFSSRRCRSASASIASGCSAKRTSLHTSVPTITPSPFRTASSARPGPRGPGRVMSDVPTASRPPRPAKNGLRMCATRTGSAMGRLPGAFMTSGP